MRITQNNIHLFLLEKGILDAKSMVDGDYSLTSSQTRNIIYKITRQHHKSLFVKQLNSFDTNNTYVLQKDATCLWLIKNDPSYANLSQHVPEYFGFDPEKQVLITEFIADAANMEDYSRAQQGVWKEAILEKLSTILATYHFPMSRELRNSRSVQFFPRQIPWIMYVGEPSTSHQNQQVAALGQNPVVDAVKGNEEFIKVLKGAKDYWVRSSLIHGDIKGMNFLIRHQDKEEELKIIDWEIADIGDPIWDVAGIFAGIITNHLIYSSKYASAAFTPVPGINIQDLEPIWKSIDFFWQGYAEKVADQFDAEVISLEKALKYTGVRLIQTAIEYNMMMPTLQPNAIKILQASYALLKNIPSTLSKLS